MLTLNSVKKCIKHEDRKCNLQPVHSFIFYSNQNLSNGESEGPHAVHSAGRSNWIANRMQLIATRLGYWMYEIDSARLLLLIMNNCLLTFFSALYNFSARLQLLCCRAKSLCEVFTVMAEQFLNSMLTTPGQASEFTVNYGACYWFLIRLFCLHPYSSRYRPATYMLC